MHATRSLLLSVVGVAAALAQTAPRPEFEVASIRPSSEQTVGSVSAGVRIDGAQVRCSYLTLKDYVGIAYRMKQYQITGPDWMTSQRFDILATLPSPGTTTQIPEMMQALLEERFQIKMHRDKKDFPVYVLEAGKSPLKLQESSPDADAVDAKAPLTIAGSGSAQGISMNLGRGAYYTFSNNRFDAKRLTMTMFTANLERFIDRPIVDLTNLKGSYDFTLDITEEDYRAMLVRSAVTAGVTLPSQALRLLDGASFSSLFDAIQKLGLRLDTRKAPLDVLVVDQARKEPTDN